MYPLRFPLPVIIRIPSVTNDTVAISNVQKELWDEQMGEGHATNWIENFISGGRSSDKLNKIRVLVTYLEAYGQNVGSCDRVTTCSQDWTRPSCSSWGTTGPMTLTRRTPTL